MKLQEGHQSETYHDSQSAWEAHGYHCYHCNCYNDPLVMNVFAHHEQAQPRNQIAYKSNSSKAQNKNNNNKPNQIKFIVISKNKVDLFKRIKGKKQRRTRNRQPSKLYPSRPRIAYLAS
jgi:hypothetical protein